MDASVLQRNEWEGLAYHMHAKTDFGVCIARKGKVESRVICTQSYEIGLGYYSKPCSPRRGTEMQYCIAIMIVP